MRRLQYFDRNTQLAGAGFDFRGDPKAILKGRVLAVCLFGAYHYAFGFSIVIGLAVVALLLALPFFLCSALRFRLHNIEYRGLRGDFSGSVGAAYRAYLPPLLTLLLPGALLAIDPSGKSAAFAFLLYLGWPLMYGAMKRYQQRHLQFGALGASYDVPARRFLKVYVIAIRRRWRTCSMHWKKSMQSIRRASCRAGWPSASPTRRATRQVRSAARL